MSRSRRKTPIFGHTTARSKAADKRLWHKRWRSHQRDQLAAVGPNDDIVPIHRNAVSSTWSMAKDGKAWFAPSRQQVVAKRVAARGKQKAEREALRLRMLTKWRGK